MSVIRKTALIVVLSCVLIAVGSTAVAGQSIKEPDSWGEPIIDDGETENDLPGDLKNASINYDEANGLLQFRINFSDDAPTDPLSNNITQIYIDTGTSDGINDNTYTDGGTTETFYDNLDNLDANERISVGDDTNVVTPWDEATSQFDGTSSDAAEVDSKNGYAVVQISVEDIGSPDEIDYKFAYIDNRNGIENEDDYTWGPDPDNSEEDSLKFSLQGDNSGETIPVGTINATVNISDTPVADDTTVEFSLNGEPTGNPVDHDSNENVTKEFSVNSDDFTGDGGDTITASIDGENYTLSKTKTGITVGEDSTTNITFEPHEIINLSGDISGLSGKSGTYNIELQNNNDETIGEPIVTSFSDDDANDYNFTGVNATKFTSGGKVVASLEADDNPNIIENDSDTNKIFSTARYNPSNIKVDFTVKGPSQSLSLTTNVSNINEFENHRFNLTVNASVDSGGDRIDTLKHVIEFDQSQIQVVNHEPLISSIGNITDTESADGVHETFIVNSNNQSSVPVVKSGASDVQVYNITFEVVDDLDPDQGDSASSENSIPIDGIRTAKNTETELGRTRMVNSTPGDNTVKELEFTTDAPSTVNVYDTETVIDPFAGDVNHLTTGGDMVDAPMKFNIPDGAVTSNDGKIDRIVLRNNDTNTVVDKEVCNGDAVCGGDLEDVPSNSTFLNNGSYVSKNRYNITAVPVGDGSNVTVENPRGIESETGQEIYERADVTTNDVANDTGNVTLGGDVLSILELRGQEAAGGLPWEDIENAQHDVNNDGVIDIVDVTIVADEYEP